MTTPTGQNDLIDAIQSRLETCGWKSESGEGWRWVNHAYQSEHAILRISYLPNVNVIRFDFESETHMAQLSISFEGSPDPILDLITRDQASLSAETWQVFIASLIELSPRILSLGGEDAEDEVITNSVEGMAALHEIDWE